MNEDFDDTQDDGDSERVSGEQPGPRMRRCRVRSPAGTLLAVVSTGSRNDANLEIQLAVDASGYPPTYLSITCTDTTAMTELSSSSSSSTSPLSERLLSIRSGSCLFGRG